MKAVFFPRLIIVSMFFLHGPLQRLKATPMYNPKDPHVLQTFRGLDKFYHSEKAPLFDLQISPFLFHAGSASAGIAQHDISIVSEVKAIIAKPAAKTDTATTTETPTETPTTKAAAHYSLTTKKMGDKVSAGNMHGRWDMFGIFYNPAKIIDTLSTIKGKVSDLSHFKAFLDSANFSAKHQVLHDAGLYSNVKLNFEKIGLRSQATVNIGWGLEALVRVGIAQYKNNPTFELDETLNVAMGKKISDDSVDNFNISAALDTIDDTISPTLQQNAINFHRHLMSYEARETIATALGIDLSGQTDGGPEDCLISLRWHQAHRIEDKDGDKDFDLVPTIMMGMWVPTGITRDVDKIFSIDLGNQGHWGFCMEGALTFDYHRLTLKEQVKGWQLSFGAGASLFTSRTHDERVPTNIHQAGLIPWKTSITRNPGLLWYANASLKVDNFLPNFSGYFDYIYTQHMKDSISLNNASSKFNVGKTMLENQSLWIAQQVNAGLKFDLSSSLAMCVAVQGHVGGVSTFRPTTVLSSFNMAF